MSYTNIYADRDIMALDCGDQCHYSKHVSAMTKEGLHSKSDIAAELAYRDLEIIKLDTEICEIKSKSSASNWISVDDAKLELYPAFYWLKQTNGIVMARPSEFVGDSFSDGTWKLEISRISHVIKLEAPQG